MFSHFQTLRQLTVLEYFVLDAKHILGYFLKIIIYDDFYLYLFMYYCIILYCIFFFENSIDSTTFHNISTECGSAISILNTSITGNLLLY
jgi:hypothetical protein